MADKSVVCDCAARFYGDDRNAHQGCCAVFPSNPLNLETSDLDPITPEEDALATAIIAAEGVTRQSLHRVVRAIRAVSEQLTKRICDYLVEEADDAMAYEKAFGRSELSEMGIMRAGYYRQAAAFIKRGEHLRIDRPRPTWPAHSIQSGGEGGEGA